MMKKDYFTIVDTFGILTNNSFNNKLNLINDLLRTDINIIFFIQRKRGYG